MVADRRLIRPFLKWPGGKARLVNQIQQHLPEGEVLIEPFVGAGAVFLNTDFEQLVINDINADLINLYTHLRNEAHEIVPHIAKLFHQKNNQAKTFYRLRDKFNASSCSLERSALFVYLNRHGFNGLCRYNKQGYYNVPFGQLKRPYFPEQEINHFIAKTQQATIQCIDFAEVMQQAPAKAVIYCDPPYVPLSRTANFTSYSGYPGFDWPQQLRLAQLAHKLAQQDRVVVISNHDTPATRELYQKATMTYLQAARSISCKGNARQPVQELLAVFQANS